METAPSPLLEKWNLNCLRYSTVWEDHSCLEGAMPAIQNAAILSIGSAGDNALSLLRHGPRRLVILDLSRAQTALVDLKLAAMKQLTFAEFIEVLGWRGSIESRVRLYRRISTDLHDDSRRYWDENLAAIAAGVSERGRLNLYFAKFRDKVIARIWDKQTLAKLVACTSLAEQGTVWRQGNLQLLDSLAREFFSKSALSLEGRDASQFAHVKEEDTGVVFLARFMNLIKNQLIANNPYLFYFFTGLPLLGENAIPLFKEKDYELLRTRLSAAELVTLDLETYLGSRGAETFDFMNLSDLFEYLSATEAERLFAAIAGHLSPRGRLAYWTLLVDRRPTLGLRINDELSQSISARDQTWFYSRFLVAELAK